MSPKGQRDRTAAYLGCQRLGVGKENMKEGRNERKKLLWNGLEETTVLVRVLLPVLVRVLLPVKWDVTSQNLTLIHIKWLGIGNKDLSLLLTFSCNPFSQMACVVQLAGKSNIIPCQQSSGWLHGLCVLWGLNFRLMCLNLNWIWQPGPGGLDISLLWAEGFGSFAKLEFGTCFFHSKPKPSQGPIPAKPASLLQVWHLPVWQLLLACHRKWHYSPKQVQVWDLSSSFWDDAIGVLSEVSLTNRSALAWNA